MLIFSLTESNFGPNQLQNIKIFIAKEDVFIRDEMGFFKVIKGMENLQTLELTNTNLTLDSSRIKMITKSVKEFGRTFCGRVYEESCDLAFYMQNLNDASTIDDCFGEIKFTNGKNMTEQIKKCEEENAEKAAEMAQRNGIIAACSVLVLLFCFLLAWKFAIVPNLPWFYR